MRTLLLLAAISLFLVNCTKNPIDELAWLKQKQQELTPCTCLTEIRQGIWEGKSVFEIRLVDPVCDGINVVYNREGAVLFTSGQVEDFQKYQTYRQNNSKDKLLWRCSK